MKICILAGEISGDKYGAVLAREMKKLDGNVELYGTGGIEMEKAGVCRFSGMPFGKMGFSAIIRDFFKYYKAFRDITGKIKKWNPDLIVLIDNPGFNLRIAKSLGRKIPCYYFIPPKIWAHNYSRIEVMRKYIKCVIPIFSFESGIYEKEGIECRWFGHPVVDIMEFNPPSSEFFRSTGFTNKKAVIGILPGSRKEEVIQLMPVYLGIISKLQEKVPVQAVFSAVNPAIAGAEKKIMDVMGVSFPIWEGNSYSVMKHSTVVLMTSGTANLETALLKTPFIVFYKTTFFSYAIMKSVVKLKNVSPCNIILEECVFPEHIQHFSEPKILREVMALLNKGSLYEKQITGCEKIGNMLKKDKVTENIARFLLRGCNV